VYFRGRFEDGIREGLRAQELDPLSPGISAQVSRLCLTAGDYDRAIEQARKSLELEPNSINGRQFLAEAYFFKGMSQQAIAEFRTLLAQLGGRGRVMPILARLGCAYARAGNRAEALKFLAQMRARPQDPGYALSVAILYAGLGDIDRAFQALEQAYAERDLNNFPWLPYFDPLRADPRFTQLVKKMGREE
jgi:tetratricopeptide (TPR) repeat protein